MLGPIWGEETAAVNRAQSIGVNTVIRIIRIITIIRIIIIIWSVKLIGISQIMKIIR